MAENEQQIRLMSWPETAASLDHRFPQDQPVPVAVSLDSNPARVSLSNSPNTRLNVNMHMNLSTLKKIPVCLSVCEPICVSSDYRVQISIFDRPVASITIRGRTILSPCKSGG